MAGYGYVERGVNSYIDWGKVSKGWADMLDKVNADREAKKKEIDEATRQTMNIVDNPELGVNNTTNQYILDGSSSTSKAILASTKEMKAGKKKPEDHIKFVQNIKDGWASFANVSKSYNQQWKEYQERVAALTASDSDRDDMAKIEKFMDINNSKILIGADGTMKVGKMIDGPGGIKVMSSDPNDYDAIIALNNRSLNKRDKFKVEESSKAIADRLGKDVRAQFGGRMESISSILQRPDPNDPAKKIYFDYEDKAVKAILDDPFNAQSVLTDGSMVNPKTGNPYEFTWDPNDPGIKTGDKILKKSQSGTGPGYTFVLTADQRKQAEDAMKVRVRSEIDYEEKRFAPPAPVTPRAGSGPDEELQSASGLVEILAKLRSGNPQEFKEGVDELVGRNPNITNVEKKKIGNKFFVTVEEQKDGVTSTRDIEIGDKNQEQWVSSAFTQFATGEEIKRKKEAMKLAKYDRKAGLSKAAGKSTRTIGSGISKDATAQEKYQYFLKRQIGPGSGFKFTGEEETDAATLQSLLVPFGFEVDYGGLGNNLYITPPEGETFEVDQSKSGYASRMYKYLQGLTLPEKTQEAITKSGIDYTQF